MSGVGNCYDNAKAEAFFSTLKTECFPPNQLFSSKALARREILSGGSLLLSHSEAKHLENGTSF
jgi:transposase InsO family protein